MSTGRYEIEYRIIRPNGTIRWIPDREIPVFNENAELYRLVGIAEDITQRKTQSQQLAVLHRVLRHNLRNDLTVVSGYAELIETIAGDEAKEYAKTIRATSDRLIDLAEKQRQIVTELESSSRPSVVELSALLQRVKRTVVETFPTADITIRIESETKNGIPSQIELAILEFVTNAIEHTDVEPPCAGVIARTRDEEVIIRIVDTGPGILDMEIDVLGHREGPLFHERGVGLWIAYWTIAHTGESLEFEENTPRRNIVTVRVPRDTEIQRPVENNPN